MSCIRHILYICLKKKNEFFVLLAYFRCTFVLLAYSKFEKSVCRFSLQICAKSACFLGLSDQVFRVQNMLFLIRQLNAINHGLASLILSVKWDHCMCNSSLFQPISVLDPMSIQGIVNQLSSRLPPKCRQNAKQKTGETIAFDCKRISMDNWGLPQCISMNQYLIFCSWKERSLWEAGSSWDRAFLCVHLKWAQEQAFHVPHKGRGLWISVGWPKTTSLREVEMGQFDDEKVA